jgi:Uma2 family endonuclease
MATQKRLLTADDLLLMREDGVWAIDSDRRTVTVHSADSAACTLTSTDTLTAEPVLPGFSLPVRELFV